MLTDEQFAEIVADLSGDFEPMVWTLQGLARLPKDERLIPYIKPFLDDQRLCMIAAPIFFAEVRWLAAEALCAQGGGTEIDGFENIVELSHTFSPQSIRMIHDLAEEINLDPYIPIIEKLQILLEQGKLRRSKRYFFIGSNNYPLACGKLR